MLHAGDWREGKAYRRGAEVLLTFPFPFRHAEAVNLLEEPTGPVAREGRSVRVPLRPWQFRTIRLWRE